MGIKLVIVWKNNQHIFILKESNLTLIETLIIHINDVLISDFNQ